MGKFGKFIGRLIAFGVFAAWFTFSIWGISHWNNPPAFIDNQKTMIVLYVPMFIGMFLLFIIVTAIGAISKANTKRKVKKKEKEGTPKIESLKDLEKLEDVKDWEEFKAMIPSNWKEKIKGWMESQE